MLRPLPLLTAALLALPVLAGVIGTLLPALGHAPAIGLDGWSLAPFRDALAWPGLTEAALLSLWTGLAATLGTLALLALILGGWHGTRAFTALERILSPLLAMPHTAAALGIAFLIAPSGWIARALAPILGLSRPPDLLIVQDGLGLSLIAGLIAKELPFLLLMSLAALPQLRPNARLKTARSLGQGRMAGWLKAIFPGVYRQIRLPVLVVLVYGMTNVDVAVILGPNTPSTLSVQVTRWMVDPDLAMRATAAAGAVIQLALVLAAMVFWVALERGAGRVHRFWVWCNHGLPERPLRLAGIVLATIAAGLVLFGLASLAVWSVAGPWRFPDLAPEFLTLRSWMRHGPEMAQVAAITLLIAGLSTLIALALTIGCLEAEHRHGMTPGSRALWLLYLPLLIPQIAFLPGLQSLLLKPSLVSVTAAHLVFVLPYVFLSLGDPWRAWDPRYARVAAGIGAGRARVLWQVRLPMLLAPVLTAAAVGMAVSVGQYLPTLLIGGGRVPTLTTEAVALAAGGDRRAIGVWGLGQAGAAFAPFALALILPALVWRNRKGMRNG
ncbi:ABC transporter permease [Anianabacter salinae]|uniref:ABC transporter permease n=1 Tax=Anianabacter salinae TaxID=2851023 RepID=UPI00225DEB23|nr:ABC transporter permease subunit [Anianabacter salinae]MBV0913726.1 ABC transporter permease subunit [Anianabacter salinae]